MDILWFISVVFVVACPFTKVEESFNVQAMHDLIYHKTNLTLYDHHEFPGVVPRTFIGPLLLTFLVSPIYLIFEILNLSDFNKFLSQCLVRIALSSCVIFSFNVYKKAVEKEFGPSVSKWLVIITGSQFHFLFYSSRPLPNIMVLPFVLLAYAFWLKQNHFALIILSAISVIIFRFELALLLGGILLMEVFFYKISLLRVIKIGVAASLVSLLCTIGVDSVFWDRLLWPEGEVFWFNSILNKSSDWGTSPFLWYFYSALPRALGTSLFLVPIGLIDKRIRFILIPPLAYIVAFSFLPHKELRFIIYTFPLLNLSAAYASHRFWIGGNKSFLRRLLCIAVVAQVAVNAIISATLLSVAKENYPGGIAISKLHNLIPKEDYVHVYIDNMAAQTGVSRFTQLHDHWVYNKTENINLEKDISMFSHLLLEAKSKYSKNLKPFSNTHTVLEVIEGFSHVAFNYNSFPPIKFKTKPMIFILKQEDFVPPIKDQSPIVELEEETEESKINKSELDSKKRNAELDRKPDKSLKIQNKMIPKKQKFVEESFLSDIVDFAQDAENDSENPPKIQVNKVIAKKHPNFAAEPESDLKILNDEHSKLSKINKINVKKQLNEPENDKEDNASKLKKVVAKKQSEESEEFLSQNIDFNKKDNHVQKKKLKVTEAPLKQKETDEKNFLKESKIQKEEAPFSVLSTIEEQKTILNEKIGPENRSNKTEKVEKTAKTTVITPDQEKFDSFEKSERNGPSEANKTRDVPYDDKKKTKTSIKEEIQPSQDFLSDKETILEKDPLMAENENKNNESPSESKKLPPVTKLDTTIIYSGKGRGAIAKHVATLKKKSNKENEGNFLDG